MLVIVLYVIFFFALAAALTPTAKTWRRVVGGVIASALALTLLVHLIRSGSR